MISHTALVIVKFPPVVSLTQSLIVVGSVCFVKFGSLLLVGRKPTNEVGVWHEGIYLVLSCVADQLMVYFRVVLL